MSKQVITIKRKHPSDATRSMRRRSQKRRAQSARQQRWTDASAMINAVIVNILNHEEDAQIRSELKSITNRIERRVKGKQSDEQVVLKAIKNGCWTLEDMQDETGFTLKFVKELIKILIKAQKIVCQDNLYKIV